MLVASRRGLISHEKDRTVAGDWAPFDLPLSVCGAAIGAAMAKKRAANRKKPIPAPRDRSDSKNPRLPQWNWGDSVQLIRPPFLDEDQQLEIQELLLTRETEIRDEVLHGARATIAPCSDPRAWQRKDATKRQKQQTEWIDQCRSYLGAIPNAHTRFWMEFHHRVKLTSPPTQRQIDDLYKQYREHQRWHTLYATQECLDGLCPKDRPNPSSSIEYRLSAWADIWWRPLARPINMIMRHAQMPESIPEPCASVPEPTSETEQSATIQQEEWTMPVLTFLSTFPQLDRAAEMDSRQHDESQTAGTITGCPVELHGQGQPITVLGVQKRKLTKARYAVIKALIEIWPDSLNKDELVTRSKHGDARKVLDRLSKSGADWQRVIVMAKTPGGGYSLSSRIPT